MFNEFLVRNSKKKVVKYETPANVHNCTSLNDKNCLMRKKMSAGKLGYETVSYFFLFIFNLWKEFRKRIFGWNLTLKTWLNDTDQIDRIQVKFKELSRMSLLRCLKLSSLFKYSLNDILNWLELLTIAKSYWTIWQRPIITGTCFQDNRVESWLLDSYRGDLPRVSGI